MLLMTAFSTASDSTGAATDMPSRFLIWRALRIKTFSTVRSTSLLEPHSITVLTVGGRLPVAVDAPFALLQSVGIPGQIVVQNGVEMFLQIYALAEAVRRHQNAAVILKMSSIISLRCSSLPSPPVTDLISTSGCESWSSSSSCSATYLAVAMKRQ